MHGEGNSPFLSLAAHSPRFLSLFCSVLLFPSLVLLTKTSQQKESFGGRRRRGQVNGNVACMLSRTLSPLVTEEGERDVACIRSSLASSKPLLRVFSCSNGVASPRSTSPFS
ncbi:hypothetical protein EUGRSUZ_B02445 [Eucalyptus grandis]|uniref:Uncharacterized protein n=2 Tax=Eucalyptus grandis TaxID=71139 RepID=A0ACC3LTN1_EUCGR|nr:hypothetical protein EUGRSUZ_B02445 [Eucalyptus grandis]